jgi:hypothetical protein
METNRVTDSSEVGGGGRRGDDIHNGGGNNNDNRSSFIKQGRDYVIAEDVNASGGAQSTAEPTGSSVLPVQISADDD